mmetsp:Transcript_64909/g.180644  ORF Transcript_64909/g.180644 Transcript_64909/m.180644 type:complete len:244 (-) Transcript_64909:245-976(-)
MLSAGIAKPMPSPKSARMLIIPMTSPSSLSMGPPLFPWFTAASVCNRGCRIQSNPVSPVERSSDETMPSVQVFCSPKGFPSTTAQSPVITLSELPRVIAGNVAFGRSLRRMHARSITSSVSRTSHSSGAPCPAKEAQTRSAPWTTCAFVRIIPVLPSMQKPEPWPRKRRSRRRASGRPPKKKLKRSAFSTPDISTFCSVSTRTTAGPQRPTTRFTKLSLTWRFFGAPPPNPAAPPAPGAFVGT